MGWIYFLAFYGAFRQNEGLMGSRGLLSSQEWFETVQEKYNCPYSGNTVDKLVNRNCFQGFLDLPSIFWWIRLDDENSSALLLVGMTLSLLCGRGRANSMAIWFLLWILYFSVVTSAGGTSFYAYGWESQVLETGFLCAFLCPNWLWPEDVDRSAKTQQNRAPSPLILWLFRWLCFRISIGAGMIKIRGDSCWTQKTCLLYHFETQPIPSPLSFVFHFLPRSMLQRAVDLDLFVQVYTSWFVILPTVAIVSSSKRTLLRKVASISLGLVRLGGYIQAGFMANIALSGNMSMLNHLTILPALACLDDSCYPLWLKNTLFNGFGRNKTKQQQPHEDLVQHPKRSSARIWMDGILFAWILFLSIPVVENLLELDGGHQKMNASFGSFRLVNSYGAFGSVGKQRYEPIISIAYETAENEELEWIEIEFPCKPGSIYRRPCFCAPYHYRLDWNIWFIGFKPHSHYLNRRESWLYHLLAKMLGGESASMRNSNNKGDSDKTMENFYSNWWVANSRRSKPWLELLDHTSRELLKQRGSPSYAKVDMYRYEMAAPLWDLLPRYFYLLWGNMVGADSSGAAIPWWIRHYEEPLLPVVAFDFQQGQLVRANMWHFQLGLAIISPNHESYNKTINQ